MVDAVIGLADLAVDEIKPLAALVMLHGGARPMVDALDLHGLEQVAAPRPIMPSCICFLS